MSSGDQLARYYSSLNIIKMKSTVKVGLDQQNNSVIKISVSDNRDDVRDELVAKFTNGLDNLSSFCKIEAVGSRQLQGDFYQDWIITPIGLSGLIEHRDKLNEAIELSESMYRKTHPELLGKKSE